MSAEPSPLGVLALMGTYYLCIFLFALVIALCSVFCNCPMRMGDVADPDQVEDLDEFEDSGIEDVWSACDSMANADE